MATIGKFISPARWREGGEYFSYIGHRYFYRDTRQGEDEAVILLIHGFPTCSWDWHKIWPALGAHSGARLIAMDMLGFGFSDKPRQAPQEHFSIATQADAIESLLTGLGVQRAHVLAHDYGDSVAMELLARDAHRRRLGNTGFALRSLCLTNGGLFPERLRLQPIQKLLLSPLGSMVARLIDEPRFRASFSRVFGPDTQPDDRELWALWRLIGYQDGAALSHRVIRYIDERFEKRDTWVQALQRSPVPIRLIDGLLDPVSGEHMVERFEELVPQAEVVRMPDIGHYPQLEAPERLLEHYLEFYARL